MSVILGNGIAILLVVALVVLCARQIWGGHKAGGCSGGCAGCSGSCASCHGSCAGGNCSHTSGRRQSA